MCRKPFVLLDGYFPESPIDSVNVDNYIGLYQAVDYLYKKGIAGSDTSKATCPMDVCRTAGAAFTKFWITLECLFQKLSGGGKDAV